jgi:signal recognition particle receptor subunit beta
MSNIGRTQNVNQTNLQTPGLNKENIYIQTSSKTSDGIIRAFYLSAMQKKQTAKHLMEVIESLKHDITTVLFEPYPTN